MRQRKQAHVSIYLALQLVHACFLSHDLSVGRAFHVQLSSASAREVVSATRDLHDCGACVGRHITRLSQNIAQLNLLRQFHLCYFYLVLN